MPIVTSTLITGASSGIGRALAIEFAGPHQTLGLVGRDMTRLQGVAEICRDKGARVLFDAIDVRDREALARFVAKIEGTTPLDLVIANAGVISVLAEDELNEKAADAINLLHINIDGIVNVVAETLPYLAKRRRGTIALMSSLSAFAPLQHAPSYSASKAAIRAYGDGLRARLAPAGVKVSLIFPGFVKTPLDAQNDTKKPFWMTPEKAATVIARNLRKNRPYIIFPRLLGFGAIMLSRAPLWLRDHLMRTSYGGKHAKDNN